VDSLAKLVSRAEIGDVLLRYSRAVDRRDWPSARACFHDDATDHHGDFKGKIDDFMPWIAKMHANLPYVAHFLGNCLIEFASDTRAVVETYFLALLQLDASSQEHKAMLMSSGSAATEMEMDVIGRYLDRFEQRDGVWRVAQRVVVYDTTRIRPSQPGARKPDWALGTRDASDPVYAWRKQAGYADPRSEERASQAWPAQG
jgi:hypothetical protein